MIKTQLKDIPPWQASEDSDNEEDQLYHPQSACNDQYEYGDDDIMLDHASSMTSSPSIPDENIDFDSVYALHAFVATVEGQATANKGDALLLMEDENTYWWLVEVLHSGEIGYIPAENIEVRSTPIIFITYNYFVSHL
jgi:SH3 domain